MAFCPNCGAPLKEGARFCAQCGSSINAGAYNPNAGGPAPNVHYSRPYESYQVLERPVIERGLTAIIGYLSWIGFIVAMAGGDRNDKYAKSHLNNALIIHITLTCCWFLTSVAAAIIAVGREALYYRGMGAVIGGTILFIIVLAAIIFSVIMWFFGLIRACRGNCKPIFLFGNIRIMK